MIRFLIPAMAAALMVTVPVAVQAAPCKDAKGKIVKCGTPGAKSV